jgi:hypothetical protein
LHSKRISPRNPAPVSEEIKFHHHAKYSNRPTTETRPYPYPRGSNPQASQSAATTPAGQAQLARGIPNLPATGSNRTKCQGYGEEGRGGRTLRSKENSADLRSARRSAIAAPRLCRFGRIGGDRGGEGTEDVERAAAAWGSSSPEEDARTEASRLPACTRTHADAKAIPRRVIGPGPRSRSAFILFGGNKGSRRFKS